MTALAPVHITRLVASSASSPRVRDILQAVGIRDAAIVSKISASAFSGSLTTKEVDAALAGASIRDRLRAKSALAQAGLLRS